jgi:16S rRNA G527 N7-methylase RsmG
MEQTNQNQNEQKKFQCTGDCLTCRAVNDRKIQWQYCAAQFTYNSMRMLESMQGAITEMQGTVKELKAKIEAIQNSESEVLAPNGLVTEPELFPKEFAKEAEAE